MKKKWIMIFIIIGIILIGLAAVGPVMSYVEKPNYKVIESKSDIELRQYKAMIIAEVQVKGAREEAIGNGFRLLADYIFGNNEVNQSISMTAPVQQQKSIKIAMTAPVQQQSLGDLWKVSFVMPSEYTMETLPKPMNKQVMLKEIDPKQFVVIRFSGKNTHQNVSQHEKKLKEYIQLNQLSVVEPLKYAFYNPPWTLPFLRRNEVMAEIK